MEIDARPKLRLKRYWSNYYGDSRNHSWFYYGISGAYILSMDTFETNYYQLKPRTFHPKAYRDLDNDIAIDAKYVEIIE